MFNLLQRLLCPTCVLTDFSGFGRSRSVRSALFSCREVPLCLCCLFFFILRVDGLTFDWILQKVKTRRIVSATGRSVSDCGCGGVPQFFFVAILCLDYSSITTGSDLLFNYQSFSSLCGFFSHSNECKFDGWKMNTPRSAGRPLIGPMVSSFGTCPS